MPPDLLVWLTLVTLSCVALRPVSVRSLLLWIHALLVSFLHERHLEVSSLLADVGTALDSRRFQGLALVVLDAVELLKAKILQLELGCAESRRLSRRHSLVVVHFESLLYLKALA